MPSTQEILQAIQNMQSNAQGALPVIPNNGNPNGANNMPQNVNDTGHVPPLLQSRDFSTPSQSMANIRDMLAQPIQKGNWLSSMGYDGPMPGSPEFQAARAAGQHPIMDWLRARRAGAGAASPGGLPPVGNTGIVPLNMQPAVQPLVAQPTPMPVVPERRRNGPIPIIAR